MEEYDDIQATADSKPGKRFWVLVIPVIIATGIALWLVPEQENPALDTSPETSVPMPELQLAPKPEAESKWLVPEQEGPAPDTSPKKSVPTPELQLAPEPEPELEPESKPEPTIEIQARPGDHAREIIDRLRNDVDSAEQAFAEAQRQHEASHFEDAYLLHFFAAKQGHAEAALIMGIQADPAHFDPGSGVLHQSDPGQAYKWYRMAADNGSSEAERRLAILLEGVKKSAAAGDEQAGRLLLQWQ